MITVADDGFEKKINKVWEEVGELEDYVSGVIQTFEEYEDAVNDDMFFEIEDISDEINNIKVSCIKIIEILDSLQNKEQ